MSEKSVPYGAPSTQDYVRISRFLYGYLDAKDLHGLSFPESLARDYEDLPAAGRVKWYSYAFQSLLGRCVEGVGIHMGRDLSKRELLFISDLVEGFIKTCLKGRAGGV